MCVVGDVYTSILEKDADLVQEPWQDLVRREM